jgi:asparagine synthase (glutamine-hydrolysing)
MCGIVGIVDFSFGSNENILVECTNSLFHRGPDGFGYQFFEKKNFQLGLGHRRLSIIDLTDAGKQPMNFNEFWIVFNGEIYNYADIKVELENLGHSFKSNSDTEVILHAYSQWGDSCLERFIGMFAFVIYNEKQNTFFMARDRAGVKPFFYYYDEELFMFSSELKSFHKHTNFKKIINLSSVQAFVQFGSVPTPHTIFENSFKLKPGHYLKFDLSTRLEKKKVFPENQIEYWSVYDSYNSSKINISFDDAKKKTKDILLSACNYRLISDVPVGVFLSGGYDSASVVSLLQSNLTKKLKTFTISVPDIGLDEAPFAKAIANHLGTDHTEIDCTQREVLEIIPHLAHYFDEPFADSSAIPTTLVSQAARKKVTVALSADAGDEVFAGYNRYDFITKYGRKINSIPSFMRKVTSNMMNKIPSHSLPILRNKYNFHNRYEKLKILLKDPSPRNIMLSISQQFTDNQIQELMLENHDFLKTSYISERLNEDNYSNLSYMMAIDYETYLVDDIMQKVDRSTMSASLEGREPYLDHRIIEWAARLPDDYKYNRGIKKYILREIFHDYIPKTIMERPKMGFAIPIGKWLQKELKELVLDHLNEHFIKDQRIFNFKYIERILIEFYENKKMELDVKIWYLLMFQMWYRRWIN